MRKAYCIIKYDFFLKLHHYNVYLYQIDLWYLSENLLILKIETFDRNKIWSYKMYLNEIKNVGSNTGQESLDAI